MHQPLWSRMMVRVSGSLRLPNPPPYNMQQRWQPHLPNSGNKRAHSVRCIGVILMADVCPNASACQQNCFGKPDANTPGFWVRWGHCLALYSWCFGAELSHRDPRLRSGAAGSHGWCSCCIAQVLCGWEGTWLRQRDPRLYSRSTKLACRHHRTPYCYCIHHA